MRNLSTLLVGLMFLAATPAVKAQAGGGSMTLSATRLTVQPQQRTATVSVANRSATTQRYRASVVDMTMGPDGQVVALGEDVAAGEHGASSWVIVSPSSLSLKPGESQTLRLLFRRPGGLRDGEYRTHLKVAQEPPADIAGGLNETQRADGMQVKIVTVYATSIPIIFAQGQLEVSAKISVARLVDAESLRLTVARTGNASFRGFARATVGDASVINMPITIYPERDEVTGTFKLDHLAHLEGPLTLTLHEGLIPREEAAATGLGVTLDTLTVVR
jgi:hypothetical protein